jgi:PadR family transcriptional regulator, regulatory protein PadR
MARQPSGHELQSLVLGILGRREAYGYEVAEALRATVEGLDLAEGSVYPALRRLERDGLASGHWVDVGVDVPRRRYYALTPKGHAILASRRPAGQTAAAPRRLGEVRP